jgi:hypothetical protein
MKKAFIVTSAIEVDNNYPLTYNPVRSYFSNEERFRQTIMTIAALDLVSDSETTIYLLDSSNNWQQYRDQLGYQRNLKFISIKDEFPEIYEITTTHKQKSYCECLAVSTFMKKYQQELFENDFILKMSGRYFIDSSFEPVLFNKYNTDKIFYKKPIQWDWRDNWFYTLVDRRKEQGDNNLRQYSSVIFGWGKKHHKHFMDIWTGMAAMLSLPHMSHYDVETLGYYLTRPFERDIIETDWTVYGWLGPTGQFARY